MKAFIADDSDIMREHLIDMLAGLGEIEVVGQAQDAGRAIESILKLEPDLVILDIRMPGGGGIEVLKAIRNDRASPVKIIFTNYPYPQYRKKCMDEGADFFFDKSTESDKLISTIERLNRVF